MAGAIDVSIVLEPFCGLVLPKGDEALGEVLGMLGLGVPFRGV